jgi:hypothetical protein
MIFLFFNIKNGFFFFKKNAFCVIEYACLQYTFALVN